MRSVRLDLLDVFGSELSAGRNCHISPPLLDRRERKEAAQSLDSILALKERDLSRVSSLGKASKHALVLLRPLYKLPVVNVKKIQEFTGLSREGANQLAKRFADMGLLKQADKSRTYGRIFIYKEYLELFEPR